MKKLDRFDVSQYGYIRTNNVKKFDRFDVMVTVRLYQGERCEKGRQV